MRGWVLTGAALALAACGGGTPAENVATPREASVPADSGGGGVVREDVTPTPTSSTCGWWMPARTWTATSG